MLKNMKVGTKLIAVLVAPVLVLVILGTIGVRQRLDTASKAQRVEQLAEMAQTSANLAQQLEVEAVYSAAYMAGGGGANTQWKTELDQQRTVTDQAVDAYKAAITKIDPGKDSEELDKAVSAVNSRLNTLQTQRRSVDGVETETAKIVEQYVGTASTASTFASLNTAIAQATDDPALSRGLTTFANLNRLKTSQANEAALLAAVTQAGYFPEIWPSPTKDGVACLTPASSCPVYTAIVAGATDITQQETIYNEAANADQKQLYRDANTANNYQKQIIATGTVDSSLLNSGNGVFVDAPGAFVPYSPKIAVDPTTGTYTPLDSTAVVASGVEQLNKLQGAENTIIGSVLSNAKQVRSDAQQTALVFLVGAIGAILIALIIAFYVARSVTVPLKKLTSAAYTLSTDKLPALVERLRNPDEATGSLSETLTPIDISTKDEIGQLADAFNSIQHVTVEVAEEQGALLRKGIGDIFINLARRNQTLLDRQIEFIDQLEANEEDPDQLDNLFKLDHLATRMRRNAESLLVLAGAEPPRRRGRPVALADVVRVAIGEVEDFARISLLALDDVTVGGNVAVDLAHLLSELMENATHFSPPDTTVEIVGHRADASYVLSVTDQGIGMSADQLVEANSQLARPPLVGLALSRSLGFIVIGRLAARFGISVKLTASPSGGVTALVSLPGDLVTIDGQPLVAPPTEEMPAPPAPPAPPADDDVVVVDPEVDAAVAADAAAGTELELEEFEETLARSEFEAEVQALEADEVAEAAADELLADEVAEVELETAVADEIEAEVVEEIAHEEVAGDRGRGHRRGRRRRGGGRGDRRGARRGAEQPPRRRARGRRLRAGPAVAGERRVGPGPGRGRSRPGPHRAGWVVRGRQRAGRLRLGARGRRRAPEAPRVLEPEAPPAPAVEPVEATAAAPRAVESKVDEAPALTAAGLVKRTPKKRSADASGGGMPMVGARAAGTSQRSPEEVRKMLSRYRSGLNKGRGGADGSTTDTPES